MLLTRGLLAHRKKAEGKKRTGSSFRFKAMSLCAQKNVIRSLCSLQKLQ